MMDLDAHTEYAYTRYVAGERGKRVGTREGTWQIGGCRRLATCALAAVVACLMAAPGPVTASVVAGTDEPDTDAVLTVTADLSSEFDQGDPARHRALARQFQRRDRQGNAGRRSGQNAGKANAGKAKPPKASR